MELWWNAQWWLSTHHPETSDDLQSIPGGFLVHGTAQSIPAPSFLVLLSGFSQEAILAVEGFPRAVPMRCPK